MLPDCSLIHWPISRCTKGGQELEPVLMIPTICVCADPCFRFSGGLPTLEIFRTGVPPPAESANQAGRSAGRIPERRTGLRSWTAPRPSHCSATAPGIGRGCALELARRGARIMSRGCGAVRIMASTHFQTESRILTRSCAVTTLLNRREHKQSCLPENVRLSRPHSVNKYPRVTYPGGTKAY